MDVFLINENRAYSYLDLINVVNREGEYYPLYKTKDVFLYFVNLVKALSTNQSLILLDSDLNSSEIDGVNESEINVPSLFRKQHFSSIKEVIVALQQSTSEITFFTSGTTGQPKKVIHTISSLTRFVRTGDQYKDQIWAYAYNPTHMAGVQVFLQAFENINTLVNVFNQSRSDVYQFIDQFQITHISATPTFYRLLLPYDRSFPSVKRVTLGGEKSEEHLYKSIRKIFPEAKINNVYASTEAGSLFAAKGDCFQIPEAIRDKFKVEKEELLIHKSLLGRSESFKLLEDYYCSGDLIEWIDEKEGFFKFKSRKNELINVGGYKVNPSEVENVLLEIEGVQQALVYGKSNSILGNVICADVKLDAGVLFAELDIRNILKERLQDFKIPRRIKFVESLSLTRTGKLKRL